MKRFVLYSFLCTVLFAACIEALSLQQLKTFLEQLDPRLHVGVQIIRLANGKVALAYNAHQTFLPGSSTKLLTAAAALHYLHPDFQFSTQLLFDEEQLYLKGSGDPSLTLAQVRSLFDEASAAGIRNVSTLVVDISDFDTEWYESGHCVGDIGLQVLIPTSALTIDRRAVVGIASNLCPASVTFSLDKLVDVAADAGITIEDSNVQLGIVSDDAAVIAEHFSQPLEQLLARTLKKSDNLYADCICKRVGASVSGEPGSWKNGVAAALDFCRNVLNISTDEITVYDGSGLSRYNAITPAFFARLLVEMQNHEFGAVFARCLPESGASGSLRNRMHAIRCSVQAKTGTMRGVSSLAGYVTDAQDAQFAFTIMVNGASKPQSSKVFKNTIEDEFCMLMATT